MKDSSGIYLFEGRGGGWFWHYRSKNGRIIADGGEPYSTASNARRAARKTAATIFFAKVRVKSA